MKKFFQEIKADIKFKSAGPGQKLTESVGAHLLVGRDGQLNQDTGGDRAVGTQGHEEKERAPRGKPNQPALQQPRQGPTSEAQMAAAAALARLEQKQPRARGPTSQESIRNQVRKELQAEATVSGSPEAPGTNKVPEPREEGSTHLAVPAVCFTCPLTGATLRKDQRDAHIKEAILSHFSTDPVAASIMKIHTFNRDRDRVKLGVDTIAKYLDNICLHPEEEKYRKIKLQNRVFQERINCLEGTHEFFEAVGFQKALLPVPDQEGPEEFYVLSEAALAQPQSLRKHKEQLLVAEPVRATLARQRRVFQPSPLASQFDLPGDFFNLTAEEVKREQRLRSEAVERLSVLRTKAMREREEQRERRRYTYTLLRVRFPDGCLLQGTFYARERVAALYAFVREALQSDWLPFELLASGGQRLSEEESPAFDECGLVPSALLTFSWDAALLEDLRAAGAEPDSSILKPELLSTIEKLS
ncbi:UBX domain-containing protein 6 isoform X1 [Prionailurus viverrinus]|uniref:UBX domain-containing protein 6 isoform X2 n=2 Tax=Prionailurus bengalensis TaxID=37029 RepID=UPI001CAA1404|nr:UBX domain-containing protein 6 isoform X2 [Prionailurus bengalensis]XP_047706217.1 UBX domain-containing protein 6 isoform X1 [Prionailurus viverrinus]